MLKVLYKREFNSSLANVFIFPQLSAPYIEFANAYCTVYTPARLPSYLYKMKTPSVLAAFVFALQALAADPDHNRQWGCVAIMTIAVWRGGTMTGSIAVRIISRIAAGVTKMSTVMGTIVATTAETIVMTMVVILGMAIVTAIIATEIIGAEKSWLVCLWRGDRPLELWARATNREVTESRNLVLKCPEALAGYNCY
ncbi:hypothetical protein VTO42DRAFT_1606 [Malbranchea cinnamomea]